VIAPPRQDERVQYRLIPPDGLRLALRSLLGRPPQLGNSTESIYTNIWADPLVCDDLAALGVRPCLSLSFGAESLGALLSIVADVPTAPTLPYPQGLALARNAPRRWALAESRVRSYATWHSQSASLRSQLRCGASSSVLDSSALLGRHPVGAPSSSSLGVQARSPNPFGSRMS